MMFRCHGVFLKGIDEKSSNLSIEMLIPWIYFPYPKGVFQTCLLRPQVWRNIWIEDDGMLDIERCLFIKTVSWYATLMWYQVCPWCMINSRPYWREIKYIHQLLCLVVIFGECQCLLVTLGSDHPWWVPRMITLLWTPIDWRTYHGKETASSSGNI